MSVGLSKSDESIGTDEYTSSEEHLGELNLPLPKNHSPPPKFSNLHFFFSLLASIHGENSTERREEAISKFITVWKDRIGNDIYPFVRLWFSEEDEQLKQLRSIKDKMVAKLLVEALDLPIKSPDAINLMDIRRGSYNARRGQLDESIAARAKQAIARRYTHTEFSNWKIDEVYDALVTLAESRKPERVTIMKKFLETMNADEIYWLIKIILGNISVNCSVRKFLTILHPDALKVYLVNKNLKMVCQQLWSHSFQVNEVDKYVHLFSHFFPMRAKFIKGTADHMESVVALVSGKSSKNKGGFDVVTGNSKNAIFFIEEKVDGERIQLHWTRDTDSVTIFSRNGKDHTLAYQSIFRGQSVEHYYDDDRDKAKDIEADVNATVPSFSMKDVTACNVDSCIIDGEVVAWDPETNDICGQSKVRELAVYNKGTQYRHMFLVFDVVYINGKVLTEVPLQIRKRELEALLPMSRRSLGCGRIQILPYKIGHTAKDISTEFDRVVSQMSEGLVVKDPNSYYEIDGRNNSWIKVKPEFVDGYQGENLDLIIVGCYWGSGRHKNKFASFLCAIKDETTNNRYVALNRVGSGICAAMYDYINEKLDKHRFAQKSHPSWLVLGNERAPDFYIEPSKSVVFEIKYSMISSVKAEKAKGTLGYGVGYSLRFPRYVRLREDKDYRSVLTIGEFMHLSMSSKTPSSPITRAVDLSNSKMSKRIKMNNDVPKEIIGVATHIFDGLTFYVCGDIENPQYMTRSQLEQYIRANGGRITTIYKPDVIPIADRYVPNAVKLVSAQVTVIHPKYIFDCIDNGKVISIEPVHYIGSIPSIPAGQETVDKFQFSFFRRQPPTEIQNLFNKIDASSRHYNKFEASMFLHQVQAAHSSGTSTGQKLRAFLFKDLTVYMEDTVGMDLTLARNMLVYGSARITTTIEDATHILTLEPTVVFGGALSRISKEWIRQCWQECKLLPHANLKAEETS